MGYWFHRFVAWLTQLRDNRVANKKNSELRQIAIDEAAMLKRDSKEKRAIARAFNLRYVLGAKFFLEETGKFDRKEDGVGLFGIIAERGNAWMCPECNRIHASIRMSTWTGLIYPKCCSSAEGSRHDDLPSLASQRRPIGEYGTNGLFFRRLRAQPAKTS